MYNQTLKERYEHKKDVLLEQALLEAFDQNMMNQATQIFKSLQSINFSGAGLNVFASARDLAISDVDEVLKSQSQKGLIRKFLGLFKKPQNPLIDAFMFCDALKNFFENFLQYIEARKTGDENASEKTLSQLIGGSTENTIASLANQSSKNETLKNLLINGFKPDGFMKKFSKGWQKKYIKNKYNEIAKELMNSNVNKLEQIAGEVVEKLKNVSEIAKSLVGAQSVASQQTLGSTGTEQSKVTEPSGGSSSTDKTSNAPGNSSSSAKDVAVKTANEVYGTLNDKFGDIDEETTKKIIAVLAYNDMIKI